MRKFTFLALCAILILSCQKEARPDGTTSNNGPATGTKLVRIGSRVGSDSITLDYSYNSANLITGITYAGTVSGQNAASQVVITRNSSNIITSYISKSAVYATIGIDSVRVTCVYDPSKSRYAYAVARFNFSGMPVADSTVFSYDASGKYIADVSYENAGFGYLPIAKDSIGYNGNNIAYMKSFTFNGTGYDLDETEVYDQYDNKINPVSFPADAPVLGMTSYYSVNNVLKRTIIDYTTNSTSVGNFTYTYDANGRPLKAVSTNGTATASATYYYQ